MQSCGNALLFHRPPPPFANVHNGATSVVPRRTEGGVFWGTSRSECLVLQAPLAFGLTGTFPTLVLCHWCRKCLYPSTSFVSSASLVEGEGGG